jgi:hypothetical protein
MTEFDILVKEMVINGELMEIWKESFPVEIYYANVLIS